GKFWESRFKSQALKTEEALLSCMAYVDLNPIRAEMADTPETSKYTSIKERIRPVFCLEAAIKSQTESGDLREFNTPLKPLLHFEGAVTNQSPPGMPFDFQDYLELVDWTGRMIRSDKRGFIDGDLPPILARLQVSPEQWKINATQFEAIHDRQFNRLIPSIDTG
ncbi:MAG: transposase, partial [Planctomycetaceae bacterium]|nr:transposase [Planctomycetaceae bacterium]